MTVQEDMVIADPPQIAGKTPRATMAARQRVAALLAGPLHMTQAAIVGKLYHHFSPDYVVLAQGVPALLGNRIQAMLTARDLAGIYLRPTYVRSYPGKDLAAGLVGFTTTDNNTNDLVGQAGIEQSFNSLLAGRDGQEQVETGITGQPIPFASQKVRPLVQGGDVRLTILASLQWEAQQACAERVRVTHADNCTIVVEQPSTGRILAMAQYPTFQPGHVTSLAATVDLPVAGIFPPGSTAKVITAAAALEHGETPATRYTVPEQITVGGFSFHDAESHPTERLTLAGIVAHSSNVGMVQVAQHVRPQVQYDYYRNFGVGVPTGLPLPNASEGQLPPLSKWWGDERYTLAFGQGVAATAVQMAGVYATIANHGVRVSPSIVAGTTGPTGQYTPAPRPHRQRVIQPSTAAKLVGILQQVPYLDATIAYQPWGEISGILGRVQDRDGPGLGSEGRLPVPVRVELHRHGTCQQPEARGGGEHPEPEGGRLLRQLRGRPGLLPRDEVRACVAEDPAGWWQAPGRAAHRKVNSGNLCACLRICVPSARRGGPCPASPRCSGSSWPGPARTPSPGAAARCWSAV